MGVVDRSFDHPMKPEEMEMKSIRQNSPLMTPFAIVGRTVLGWVNDLGSLVIFVGRALVLIFQPKQIPMIIEQIYFIGAKSATIVMLVGLFSGMVLGLQLRTDDFPGQIDQELVEIVKVED